MKTRLQSALLLLMLSAMTASAQAVKINPATGLPSDGSAPPRIDPATGLQKSDSSDGWKKAKDLMNQGQYEDSLQAFQDYFERSRFDQGQAGQRLFSLVDWVELGRRYPRAKQALRDLCATNAQILLSGDGDFIYFSEVSCINQDLGYPEASCNLFKAIEQRDPHLAGQCYAFVEDQLVQNGEYETCRKYLGDPESAFQSDCDRYRMDMANNARMEKTQRQMMQQIQELNRQHPNVSAFTPPDTARRMEKMAKDRFVGKVRELIEILVATGDKADAVKIQHEAIGVLDDPRLEMAVADADEKIIHEINTDGGGQSISPPKQY